MRTIHGHFALVTSACQIPMKHGEALSLAIVAFTIVTMPKSKKREVVVYIYSITTHANKEKWRIQREIRFTFYFSEWSDGCDGSDNACFAALFISISC